MTRHLSPEQLATLRSALLARRAALEAQQQGHLDGRSRVEHAREVLLQDGDDAPQRDADREVDLAIADREVVALTDIDAALTRLQAPQGHYGLCLGCEDEIPFERLQLQPTALRCVACEGRRERAGPRTASM